MSYNRQYYKIKVKDLGSFIVEDFEVSGYLTDYRREGIESIEIVNLTKEQFEKMPEFKAH